MMSSMIPPRIRKKPVSDMNVVPYIDVMLVLLVIFMITAPLLTQGVKVDLPQTASQPVEQQEKPPLEVTVDRDRNYYLNVGGDEKTPISGEELSHRVAAVLRRAPETPVYVRGDTAVDYGAVVEVMTLLQQAGAPSVGLLTEPPSAKK